MIILALKLLFRYMQPVIYFQKLVVGELAQALGSIMSTIQTQAMPEITPVPSQLETGAIGVPNTLAKDVPIENTIMLDREDNMPEFGISLMQEPRQTLPQRETIITGVWFIR